MDSTKRLELYDIATAMVKEAAELGWNTPLQSTHTYAVREFANDYGVYVDMYKSNGNGTENNHYVIHVGYEDEGFDYFYTRDMSIEGVYEILCDLYLDTTFNAKENPKTYEYVITNDTLNRRCNRCNSVVLKETQIPDYPYQCLICDENLYEIETHIGAIHTVEEFDTLCNYAKEYFGLDKDKKERVYGCGFYVCSNCGVRSFVNTDYCPNCGGKLK